MNLRSFKLLSFFYLFFQITNTEAQISNEESIKYIRRVFIQTNSLSNLEQYKLENEQLTDEVPDGGVSLTGFFKGKLLLKIENWAGLSYGVFQIDYYFDKDSLVFAYVTEKHFRQSGDSIIHSKVDLKYEGRFYFRNDKLIHKTTNGKGFWSDSKDGVESLLPESKNYLNFLYLKKG